MNLLLPLSDLLALWLSLVLGYQAAIPMRHVLGVDFQDLALLATPGVRWGIYSALSASFILWCGLNKGHYSRRKPHWDELRDVWAALMAAALADAAMMYMAKLSFSRLTWVISWALALVLVPTLRRLAKAVMMKLDVWQMPTLIVGTGPNAEAAVDAIQSEHALGYQVRGILSVGSVMQPRFESLVQSGQLAFHSDLAELLGPGRSWRGWQFVLALEPEELSLQPHLVHRLTQTGALITIAPPLRGLPMYGTDASYVFSHEVLFLRVRNNLARRAPRFLKRLSDIVLTSLALAAASPVMVVLAFLVCRDGGPALFAHPRIGRGGRPFHCYKFRSMTVGAEERLRQLLASDEAAREQWERDHKLKDDPRVTKLGSFMRRTSLDELPQLLNVLRGEMSLVGPRPIVDAELQKYGEYARYYLQARPGITGLWQVSGRNDTDYSRRVALDTWYVQNWSLWYDIVILFKTIRVVLLRAGAY